MKKFNFKTITILTFVISFFIAMSAQAKTYDFGPYDYIQNFSVSNKNWGFSYLINKKISFNINSVIYGPYQYNNLLNSIISENNWGFIDCVDDNTITYTIKGIKFGPYTAKDCSFSGDFNNGLQIFGNSWGFRYIEKGSIFYNINGKTYGPYDSSPNYEDYFTIDDKGFSFVFMKNNKYFFNINNAIKGPFNKIDKAVRLGNKYCIVTTEESNENEISSLMQKAKNATSSSSLTPSELSMLEKVLKDQSSVIYYKGTIYTNEKKYGPYEKHDCSISENVLIIEYFKNDGIYRLINGKEYGPYNKIMSSINESLSANKWGFAYIDNSDQEYANINGKTYGPFASISNLLIKEKNWGIAFQKKGDNKSVYYMINGSEYNPRTMAPAIESEMQITDSLWAFIFKKSNNIHDEYVNINGKIYGPYPILYSNEKIFTDKNILAISYYKQYTAQKIILKDGKIYNAGEGNGEITIRTASDNWGYIYPDINDKRYVKIIKKDYSEAELIYNSGYNLLEFLNEMKKKIDKNAQAKAMKKYTEPMCIKQKLSINQKYAINNFIVYGTKSNQKLLQSKRAAIIKKYKIKNKKLPTTEKDWTSVVEMAKN